MKNGKIEMLRFIFCIVIVLFHARNILPEESVLFKSGAFAVEFFAIVSGYLMIASIEKIEKKTDGQIIDVGKESIQFLWRKVKNLYPEIIIAWLLAFLVRQSTNYQGIEAMAKMALNGFWELTLLQMSGLLTGKINSVTWYISAILLSMAVLYPLLRKYKNFMIHIGCPLIILFVFGWLCREYGHLRTPLEWTGFAYKGTLRILAELCVGIICYQLAKWLKSIGFTKNGRYFLTFVEMGGYLLLLFYMQCINPSRFDYFFVLIWCIAIAITFSGKTVDVDLYNNKVCYFLGWLSMPLYLSHQCSMIGIGNILVVENYSGTMIWGIYLLGVFLNCSIVVFFSRIVRKTCPRFLSWFKAKLLI